MTIIHLKKQVIDQYLGTSLFNGCQEITEIHLESNINSEEAKIAARIPATTTRQQHYNIGIWVRLDGSSIVRSFCTCPVAHKCKHIHKVLTRISQSSTHPIGGPSHVHLERVARRQRLAEQMTHASVYIVLACRSEMDSGSDFRRSYFIKEKFEEEIIGVFFSKRQANQCAKDHVENELGQDVKTHDSKSEEEDEEEEDYEYDSDDEASYDFDGSDIGEYGEDNAFDKVWVERRAIVDASPRFHK